MYDYYQVVKEDILEYLHEERSLSDLKDSLEFDRDDLEQELYDDLFVEDSVTGNASGSYTFSYWVAGENLLGNWDLLQEALEAFGESDINPIEKGEEWCDVTIRCYLLGQEISEALDELEEELNTITRVSEFLNEYDFYELDTFKFDEGLTAEEVENKILEQIEEDPNVIINYLETFENSEAESLIQDLKAFC